MFTNNFVTWFRACIDYVFRKPAREIVNTNGVSVNVTDGYFTNYYVHNVLDQYKNVRTNYSGVGVVFGTGDTPPAGTDYKLSGDIISGLASSCAAVKSDHDEYGRLSLIYTLTNGNANEVTVREVGFIGDASYYTTSTRNLYALFHRVVLESPVTIPASGVAQVTVDFDLFLPYST